MPKLHWCVSEQSTQAALRLLGALRWLWFVQDQDSEILSWFNKIRSLPDIYAYPAQYARLLNQIGHLHWLASELYQARSVLKESQTIWRNLGVNGELGLAEALNFQGMFDQSSPVNNKLARSLFEQSFEIYQKHGDQWGMAFVFCNLGINAGERNDDSLALSMLEQSLDLFSRLGDTWGTTISSHWLGESFLKQENYEKARLLFGQQLIIDEALKFKKGTVIALLNLGKLYCYQRDYAQAEQYIQKSLAISREYGLKWNESLAYYYFGLLELCRNNYVLSAQYFKDYHSLYRKVNEVEGTIDFLYGLAAVAAGMNQSERAAKLSGAVQALFETTDYRISRFDRAEFDRHIEIVPKQISETRFKALVDEGRAMTMEQAAAYALETQGRGGIIAP